MKKIILVVGSIVLGFSFVFYTSTKWNGADDLSAIEGYVDSLIARIQGLDSEKSEYLEIIEEYANLLGVEEETIEDIIKDLQDLEFTNTDGESEITLKDVQDELDRLYSELLAANQAVSDTRNEVEDKVQTALSDYELGVSGHVDEATFDGWLSKITESSESHIQLNTISQ